MIALIPLIMFAVVFAALLARVARHRSPMVGRAVLGTSSAAALLVGGFWLFG